MENMDRAVRKKQLNLITHLITHFLTWRRLAPTHYPSQSWATSMMPYVITRPQWVNHSITSVVKPEDMVQAIAATAELTITPTS